MLSLFNKIILSVSMVVFFTTSVQAMKLNVIMEQVPDYDIVVELTKQYESENPGVEVVFDAMPYDAMRDKILSSFLAPNATYDIIIIDNPWADEFANAGFLAPLDSYISNTPGYEYGDFIRPIAAIAEVNGKVYGIPYYNYALGLIVRQDIFDQRGISVPKTIEEYVSVSKKLTGSGVYGAVMQPQRGYKIYEEWKNWLHATGGNLTRNGKVILNNSQGVKALEMYIDTYKNSAPKGSLNWGFDEALNSMATGKAVTMLSYNWMLPTLNNPSGPAGKLAGKFKLYEVPGGISVLGTWHWAIPKNSGNKNEAWKYISWLTSPGKDKIRVIQGGAPVRTSVVKDPEVWSKGYGADYYFTVLNILEDADPLSRGNRAEEIIEIVGTDLNAAVAGQKSAKQALDNAAAKVRKIINK